MYQKKKYFQQILIVKELYEIFLNSEIAKNFNV